MTDEPVQAIAGALFGVAVGDAVGSTYEGLMPAHRRNLRMAGGGQFSLPKGAVTDDTLMTLDLAESRLEGGHFDRDAFLCRMSRTVRANPAPFGRTTRTLVSLLEQGCVPDAAVRVLDHVLGSRTNGSVMRTIPVGILEPAAARRVSAFTHYDPAAGECCAVVSRMIAELIRGAGRDEAYAAARRITELEEIFVGDLIPSVDAVESTRCALYCFLSGDSVRDVVERAVSLGGDTDTIAAVAGGMAGAFWGVDRIPDDWICALLVKKRVDTVVDRMLCAYDPDQ